MSACNGSVLLSALRGDGTKRSNFFFSLFLFYYSRRERIALDLFLSLSFSLNYRLPSSNNVTSIQQWNTFRLIQFARCWCVCACVCVGICFCPLAIVHSHRNFFSAINLSIDGNVSRTVNENDIHIQSNWEISLYRFSLIFIDFSGFFFFSFLYASHCHAPCTTYSYTRYEHMRQLLLPSFTEPNTILFLFIRNTSN